MANMTEIPGQRDLTSTPLAAAKAQSTNRLAAMIPQIMNAIGGGDQKVQQALMQQDQMNQQQTKRTNLRNFMRAVTSPDTGEITEKSIMSMAAAFGVDPLDAMGAIQAFDQHRKAMRPEKETFSRQIPGVGLQTFQARGREDIPDIPGAGPAMLGTITPEVVEKTKGFGSAPGGIYSKETGEIVSAAPGKEPGLIKVPDGKGGWKIVEKEAGAAGPGNPPRGMRVVTNPDGTTTIETGVTTGGQLTRPVRTQVQKDIISAQDQLEGLKTLGENYDDQYLKGWKKIGFKFDAIKDKWGLGTLSEPEKVELGKFTTFRQNAVSQLNDYIQKMTGAAMGEKEAQRLSKAMADPGTGFIDGDSPVQFKAKYDGFVKEIQKELDRNLDRNTKGITMDIDRRGSMLETKFKRDNPGASADDIDTMVMEALSKEFEGAF